MDKELLRSVVLLVMISLFLIGFGYYTYDFYRSCNGAVVQGAFGWACVAGGR